MIPPPVARMAAKRKQKKSAPLITMFMTLICTLMLMYVLLANQVMNSRKEDNCDTKVDLDGIYRRDSPKIQSSTASSVSSLSSSNHRALNCNDMLRDFLNGKIEEMELTRGFEKSFVTRTVTSKPFYWATHKIELDHTRASSYSAGYYYEKQLSQRVVDVFDMVKKEQGEESIFLDVGGNIGWFSLLAAAHGASKVYTFEPNPSNLVRICESLNLNGWNELVDLMMVGVSDQDGKQTLFKVNPTNPGAFSFDVNRANKYNGGKPQQVAGEFEMMTLDTFAEEMGWFESRPKIGFFKLDVEGYEPKIIKGAERLFKSRLIQMFALEMKNKLHHAHDKRAMIKIFFESGYELYMHGTFAGPRNIVEDKFDRWEDLAQAVIDRKYGENLLFRRIEQK